ncbi:hypothetical protein V7S43_013228 [Phytophthora oleae]|uniref:Uncharacterized protein n=1 Tax=Phytophthora oleae TaxID=2107226 RepID=A0ABD3F540_9STRA
MDPQTKLPPVGVNMLVSDKEKFHSGWNLWLAAKKHHPISTDEINKILAMKYRGKSPTTFRLSVWNNPKRRSDQADPEFVPFGFEITAESVTGLRVYLGQVAQGNTSSVEIVQHDPCGDPRLQEDELSDFDDDINKARP